MIDASTFATRHNAFWSDQTPTSELFVRRLNLEHVQRWDLPMTTHVESSRAAYVAELAFSLFAARLIAPAEKEIRNIAVAQTIKRLVPVIEDTTTLQVPLNGIEESIVTEYEQRLARFFGSRLQKIVARPNFEGCGYVDASEGDVICGNTLFEIKIVDRPFRGIDVRQLISYCALNHISKQYQIDLVGGFNPRRGVYFEMPIEKICFEISGKTRQALFDAIIHALSSGDLSR